MLRIFSVFVAFLLASGADPAYSNPAQQGPLQPWVKRGVLIEPGFAGPASSKLVSSPSVVKLDDGTLRMYFWAADGVPPWHGRHIILAAEASPDNPFEWTLLSSEAMVGPDPSGNIRDRGVGFPFVLPRSDGPWLMYYGTWGSWAPPDEISNRTGLATSDDGGITWQVVRETALPLGEPGSYDGGLTGSVMILRDAPNRYMMWYTAGEKYVRFGARNRGIVHVGMAESTDGINWKKREEPVIRARLEGATPYEAVVSKPAVVKIDGVYHMWFCVYSMSPEASPSTKRDRNYQPSSDDDRSAWESITRNEQGYRIEYARSTDGVNWERFPDRRVFDLTPGGFDSENQSYPSIVDMGSQLWMFYVGNEFGSTGIGLATLEKSALK